MLLGLLVVLIPGAAAQNIAQNIAQDFFRSCETYFARGDFDNAQGACRSAVTTNPNLDAAQRLLARVALAEARLQKDRGLSARDQVSEGLTALAAARKLNPSPENDLIDAEFTLLQGEASRAAGLAAPLTGRADLGADFQGRALVVAAGAARLLGRDDEAALRLRDALQLTPSNLAARRELARVLLATDPKQSVEALRATPGSSGSTPVLQADLGRALWIAGNLPEAVRTLEGAVANPAGFREEPAAYRQALGALAYAYYGQGQVVEGGRVLAQYADTSTENPYGTAVVRLLPWILAAVALLALHLVGESRIEPISTIEIQEGPRPWSVVSVYRLVLLAALGALLVSLVLGRLAYGNYLAILTPFQGAVTRDVYFTVFAVILAAGSAWAVKAGGWKPREMLFGPARRDVAFDGLLVGVILLAVTLAHQYLAQYLPSSLSRFYLDLNVSAGRASLVLPLLALPLTEVFYRAYALFPFEKRYGRELAYPMLAILYAVTLGSPFLLLFATGLALLFFTDREKSTIPAIVAQWVYYAGLAIALLAAPAIKNWF